MEVVSYSQEFTNVSAKAEYRILTVPHAVIRQ